jgi:hypothetical protein
MGLNPIAFDIETSGLNEEAVITVAGFAHSVGVSLILNVDDQDADHTALTNKLEYHPKRDVSLYITDDEKELIEAISEISTGQIDGDRHYLTAYNGETWNGGFDLPFCRTRFLNHGMEWPFQDLAYADMMGTIERFETHDQRDLVSVYDQLISNPTCDPFEGNEEAVDAFEAAEWLPLLKHNLADIQRTRELALLAGRFVPRSDFGMKNLQPPR